MGTDFVILSFVLYFSYAHICIVAQGYVRKAVSLYYLRRFDEAETTYKHLTEIDPATSAHSVGKQQSALGVAVSRNLPDGSWGQLVAPFSSEAPHGIHKEAFVLIHSRLKTSCPTYSSIFPSPSVLVLRVIGCLIEDVLE